MLRCRWPWRRWRDDPPPPQDGAEAKAEAQRKLRDVQQRDGQIREVVRRLEQVQGQNQFARLIEDALRRSR